ncbi:NifB/NifX family molybdenum-iron cluster-binding protein [uncultured Methanobrevibacter sp.]|uniref:NifB/NifX family molybdenum-iron cluster-binding protein n=1 Tax=uncultured Methanobrevibacter sp. TaxID=253161 RepID=UPI0026353319|nr:NifB/NifX family molybdenum-iron cluster-binding protein [uncultured Methanobrevibacter sp.]
MRIALASSNGKTVDLHLGKAVSLVIYDILDDESNFVETRNINIDKEAKHQGGEVINECSDCDVIIATQYGFKSKIKAEDAGIKLVGDEGPVEDVLQRYLAHYKFMNS